MKQTTTASNILKKLRKIFIRFELPKICVMDKCPQSSRSTEFVAFLSRNGIKCVPIPSYHPASNAQAESMVGKFKQAIRKMIVDPLGEVNTKL